MGQAAQRLVGETIGLCGAMLALALSSCTTIGDGGGLSDAYGEGAVLPSRELQRADQFVRLPSVTRV